MSDKDEREKLRRKLGMLPSRVTGKGAPGWGRAIGIGIVVLLILLSILL